MALTGLPMTRHGRVVGCRDLAGRRHEIIVLTDAGRIVLVGPAGATAVLEPRDVGQLRAALRDAVMATTGWPRGRR